MQVILSRQQAEELIAKIDDNFERKGKPVKEATRPRYERLKRRNQRLNDLYRYFTYETDYRKLLLKTHSDFDIKCRNMRAEVIHELSFMYKNEETPCIGYGELKKLLDSELTNQIIVDSKLFDRLQRGVSREFRERDFFDIDLLRERTEAKADQLFRELRVIKKKVGRYPVKKTIDSDYTEGVLVDSRLSIPQPRPVVTPTTHQNIFAGFVFAAGLVLIAAMIAKFG